MPEEPDVPLESVHEEIHHHVEHSGERWTLGVALSSALIAALAAVSSLLAGHHSDEALIEQMKATDQWAYYQAKGIKANILASKMELQRSLGKETDPVDEKKVRQYSAEQEEIKDEAQKAQQKSAAHIRSHNILARAVTFFQISIAIGAISVLTKRKWFWFVGLLGALIGTWFLVEGIIRFHA
ncbi:MAG TPA: DUF4337 domain-containing protein [Chthoniobacterales bacterium]|jgi:hypothetical protein|nr:DUF4337 domain-containing protein [Chthoniobacterales bacterium]